MKREENALIRLLVVAAVIILTASLESLLLAKSNDLYMIFKEINPGSTFNEYIGIIFINFTMNILEPVLISLYFFITRKKIKVSSITKFVFGGLVIIRLISLITIFNVKSVFYYLLIILYMVFFITIVMMPATRKGQK